ncbi:type II secretion system protein [Sulfurimonas sediminis]|uniref:type II secretion system protein n=1 Tax=Sulfurimonas sediminis TaxID=2590020 RepID=UPI001D059D1B|nr:type II secretion system protein [Sulfurimonas sediminis]
MKRAGFTMIELIFVIVILGILAAVAIPKLAATRTDAQVAKISTEAATLVSELGTFYTAQGTFEGKNSADITNISLKTSDDNIQNNDTIVLGDDNNNTCLTITFNNASDGNITVSADDANGTVCNAVKEATADLQKTYNFGGSNVAY